MPDPLPPEPPHGSYVLAGEPPLETVYVREDRLHRPDSPHRWYELRGEDPVTWQDVGEDPVTWQDVVEPLTVPPDGGEDRRVRRPVVELVPRDQVDREVTQASVTPVGEHLIEAGGYCRTCTSHHSTVEIARLEDRLAEDAGDG